jgi:hypothetical protein
MIKTLADASEWPDEIAGPCVILPFLGEFGWFVHSFIRQVALLRSPEKIVCCRPGEELYFPSANGFLYDWEDPFKDAQRCGYRNEWPVNPSFRPTAEEVQLIQRIGSNFPRHQIIHFGAPLSSAVAGTTYPSFEIPPRSSPAPDVVVSCRKREWDAYRNFDQWPRLLNSMASAGCTLGVVGQKETTYDFEYFVNRSWESKDPTREMFLLLRECRVYLGADSGPTQLAVMISPRVAMFRNEDCPYPNNVRDVAVPIAKLRKIPFAYVQNGWTEPDRMAAAVVKLLRGP